MKDIKIQGFILYKIYYSDILVYLGRTKQPLQDRIRGHLFQKPMHRSIDINQVSKIEYAEFKTEADMNIYEIYFINLLKPPLNVDDKTRDEVTVTLPDVDFKPFKCHLWESWKSNIAKADAEHDNKYKRYRTIHEDWRILRKKKQMGEITEAQYYEQKESLEAEEKELNKYLKIG